MSSALGPALQWGWGHFRPAWMLLGLSLAPPATSTPQPPLPREGPHHAHLGPGRFTLVFYWLFHGQPGYLKLLPIPSSSARSWLPLWGARWERPAGTVFSQGPADNGGPGLGCFLETDPVSPRPPPRRQAAQTGARSRDGHSQALPGTRLQPRPWVVAPRLRPLQTPHSTAQHHGLGPKAWC